MTLHAVEQIPHVVSQQHGLLHVGQNILMQTSGWNCVASSQYSYLSGILSHVVVSVLVVSVVCVVSVVVDVPVIVSVDVDVDVALQESEQKLHVVSQQQARAQVGQ